MPYRIIWSWYTGRWCVSCYIWYSDEPAQAPPNCCTKCNSPPINGQCTKYQSPLLCVICLDSRWRYLATVGITYKTINAYLTRIPPPRSKPIYGTFRFDSETFLAKVSLFVIMHDARNVLTDFLLWNFVNAIDIKLMNRSQLAVSLNFIATRGYGKKLHSTQLDHLPTQDSVKSNNAFLQKSCLQTDRQTIMICSNRKPVMNIDRN